MTTRRYNTALLLFLLCLTSVLSAAQEAEYKKLSKRWTLHADGSQEFRCRMELTLFTHTAMNGTYGESFILYDPLYQVVQIHDSYTKQKDGTVIKTPDNAFVESLPYAAADAPAYNRLKELVIVHTGLEPGATICLDYSIQTQPDYLPELDIFEELLQSSPVKEYTLTVATPEAKPLAYTLAGNTTQPAVDDADGTRTTTWTLRNLPAASRTPFVSVANGDVPFLAATTYPSEETALKGLFRQFNPPGDLQLEALAENLTEGKDGNEERLKRLLAYVIDDLADSPLSLTQTGYRLRKADDVIRSAYGTTIEKVNLLIGLLNAAGYAAEPMATYCTKIPQGTALKAIDRLYVKCMVGSDIYLFSVHSRMRPQTVNFDRMPLYSLATGKPVALAIPEDYRIRSDYTFSLDGGQLAVGTKATIGKTLFPYFTPAPEAEHHDTLPATVSDGYLRIVLPDATQGIAYRSYGRLNSRRDMNLSLPYPVDEHYTYRIECADGMTLCTPAKDLTLRNEAGELTFSLRQEGQTVYATRSLKLAKQLYTPSEYKELRRLLVEWGEPNGKSLLFSVKK